MQATYNTTQQQQQQQHQQGRGSEVPYSTDPDFLHQLHNTARRELSSRAIDLEFDGKPASWPEWKTRFSARINSAGQDSFSSSRQSKASFRSSGSNARSYLDHPHGQPRLVPQGRTPTTKLKATLRACARLLGV